MSHYYENDENLEHDIKRLKFEYKNACLFLYTDNGVFSKDRVDYGTRVLLEAIELEKNNHKLLDVGCGYGAIGLSLKKIYSDLKVDMVDVNQRAMDLARQSALENKLEVNVFESDVYENVTDYYDVILSNPPIRAGKSVVHRILKESINYLNNNGCIYIVIQKKQGAPSAKKTLEEVFGNCEIIKRDRGYYILKSVKIDSFETRHIKD